jgi:chromosome segregation ATPase
VENLEREVENLLTSNTASIEQRDRLRNRIAEIPTVIQQTQAQLNDVAAQLATSAPSGEHPELTRARRTLLVAQKGTCEAELERLNREQLFYTATADLLPEQRAMAKQRMDDSLKLLESIQRTIDQQQESTLQRFARETQELQKNSPAQLQSLADSNAALVETYRKLLDQNTQNLARLKEVKATAEETDRQFRASTERVKAVGLTAALGVMLTQQRREVLKASPHAPKM